MFEAPSRLLMFLICSYPKDKISHGSCFYSCWGKPMDVYCDILLEQAARLRQCTSEVWFDSKGTTLMALFQLLVIGTRESLMTDV